ncbi:alpha/beta hydrolase family protein [Nocardia sp. CDC153]|uniref:alpha/beta hydrolase n=1 Tax=Nocardia sp. CDC153 TaxID=3112167 RepID=UPI002DBD2395|nr:alpha/beta hydrolase family protein [Nocardia sp. CDC153]MEC3953448.1 alpha/beta hydrolase family protein [Nocardia sp. CDC153]
MIGTIFASAVAGFGAAVSSAETGDPIIESSKLLADPVAPDGSKISSGTIDGRNLTLQVYSAAMDKKIQVKVQRPNDASQPRPTLYLVNGAGGGTDSATWWAKTDVGDFLAGKDVNVVMPIGGAFAYYTDWQKDDPSMGRNKWRTFFLDELPPLIDKALGTNGINAIAANSMTATSILQMAEAKPGLYRSVAGYSGCAQIADPIGKRFTKLVVETYGGGDVRNMYGSDDDPDWAANDPVLHAEALRGTNLFLSTGNGLPGQWDTLNGPYTLPGSYGLANQILVGGIIEAATNWCTHNLQDRLSQLQIPATFDYAPTGTHSWGYWRDAFYQSWPMLADGLGIPA